MIYDENFDEKAFRNSKNLHPIPVLTIPDPLDVFRKSSLQRPPSVPILGRRLSSESLLNMENEKESFPHSSAAFKKYRRKSVQIPMVSTKPKLIRKQSESKTHLQNFVKSIKSKSKALSKKSSINSPQVKRSKKVLAKPHAGTSDVASITPDKLKTMNGGVHNKNPEKRVERHRSSKGIRLKNSEQMQSTEFKAVKTQSKTKKCVGIAQNYDKTKKQLKKVHQDRLIVLKTDETPNKKRPKKIASKPEKSSSHSINAKLKTNEEAFRRSLIASKNFRKKSKEKNKGKLMKKPSDIYLTKPDKKAKQISKHKILERENKFHKWLDHSFCIETKNKDEDSEENRFFNESSVEQANEIFFLGSECFPSLDNNLNIEILNSPIEELASKNASCPISSNPEKSISPSPAPEVKQRKNKLKLLRKPPKPDLNSLLDKAATKIQAHFRGYLLRKAFNEYNIHDAEHTSSQIFELDYEDNVSEDDEVKKIIGELQINSSDTNIKKKDSYLNEDNQEFFDEPNHKNDNLEPALDPRSLSPSSLAMNDLSNTNKFPHEKSFADDNSYKIAKIELDELRNRDFQLIKRLNSQVDSESQILELFQNIISRRYADIRSMFDENIKAVQEALADSVISEDSSVSFKDSNKHLMAKLSHFEELTNVCKPLKVEEAKLASFCEFKLDDATSKPGPEENGKLGRVSSKIVWIDEVAMPSDVNFTDLLIDSAISELMDILLNEILEESFCVTAEYVRFITEEIIKAIISNEAKEKVKEMRSAYDEESILFILHRVFIKTRHIIVEELTRPLEKDPLMTLSEIQETEIGAGFLPEERYAMLNFEAFSEVISNKTCQVEYFNRMIFDCINESLEMIIYKDELPWTDRRNYRKKIESPESVLEYLENRLMRLNGIKAGAIHSENSEGDDKTNEELATKNRERGVLNMLADEVEEREEEWRDYEKEETQAKLDIADMIIEQEIEDAVEILINY